MGSTFKDKGIKYFIKKSREIRDVVIAGGGDSD
jgi:hypothetical protein